VEKIKAIIDFYKTIFLVSITVLFSLIGYFFSNFSSLEYIKIFVIVYSIIIFTAVVLLFLILWRREINKLKD
jgi:lipopolysaccharide export LptBFGC system permease protein LptF